MATMIRVDEKLHATLQEIARAEHRPMGHVVDEAVRRYQREKFWLGVREDYARLQSDPDAWRAYRDEIAMLEGGSMDGLEHEEPYYTPYEEEQIRAEHDRAQRG